MTRARRLAEWLVYTNVVVAAAAASLTFATFELFGAPLAASVVVLAGAATWLVYTADRLLPLSPEDEVNTPRRVAFVARHRRALELCACGAALLTAVSAAQLSARALLVCAALGAIVIAYGAPVLPGRQRLKDVPGLKPLVVGLCWAAGSVCVPLVQVGAPLDTRAIGLVVFRTLFIAAAALAFDVRDAVGDGRASLVTRLGEAGALRVCKAAFAMAFGLACVAVASGLAQPAALGSVVAVVVLWIACARAERLRDDVYLGVVVDGALVLPGVLALALHGAGLTPVW